ncbi:MAG: hypothetical protein ABF310_11035, partial [Paracoccaceae bacterium]
WEIEVPNAPDDDLDDVPKMGINLARPEMEDVNVTKLSRQREAVQGYLASVAAVNAPNTTDVFIFTSSRCDACDARRI